MAEEKHCATCGQPAVRLPNLHPHAKREWYGCEKCNVVTVFEGGGTYPCALDYDAYMKRIKGK